MHCDVAIISQALVKLPKLKKLIVADQFSIDGKPMRSSGGAARLSPFRCVTEHCKPDIERISASRVGFLVNIIGAMRPHPLPKLGLDWSIDEDEAELKLHLMSQDLAESHTRLTDVQLKLRSEYEGFKAKGMENLINVTPLESLEVQYLLSRDPVKTIHIRLLALENLQRVVLNGLHARRRAFSDFFRRRSRHRAVTLKRVSIINCSIALREKDKQNSEKPQWTKAMRYLKEIKDLDFLHLEKLHHEHSETGLRGGIFRPYQDVDLSIRAVWITKHEVDRGLAQLIKQMPGLTFYRERGPGNVPDDDMEGRYLHLRFANIKASASAFWWTYQEVIALAEYRFEARGPTIRSGTAVSPFEDVVNFPIPRYGLEIYTGIPSKPGEGSPHQVT
jgi:hypothetical protein